MSGGVVEAIFIARERGGPTEAPESVRVVPAQGIEGDRKFSPEPVEREGAGLTLIEAGALEALEPEHGNALADLGPSESAA
ncbi:MAG TPA: hypothetical protein VNT32_05745 [Thermoleophilaceae bacterium]|nr:hypothetical protein [Thermoleophilaceae bacterium]